MAAKSSGARRNRDEHDITNPTLLAVRKKLNRVALRDREPLRRRLNRLEQDLRALERAESNSNARRRAAPRISRQAWENGAHKLELDCDASIKRVDARRRLIPKLEYDSELPVSARRDEIKKLLRENQVVVVCGETGSGKSTQLPKICLELGLGARGMIGCTQPRRIAARSIAQRVADELRVPLGSRVGYKIRFTDNTSEDTLVKFMTDGILLAETQADRNFNEYEVIIVDEAHERSLNVDFLLGMLKRTLRFRRDLKVIITSATIDAQRFAEHFYSHKGPAPIIEISGRSYPIEIRYRPPEELALRREAAGLPAPKDDDDFADAALLDAIDELARHGGGDMLVFMPTERDIVETAKLLKGHAIPGDDAARKTNILPLYARLPAEDQQKIFGKTSSRKIVIATNVAESSLTVPGIRYVIDTGTARISRYSARSMTQRLPIEPISQASANQRAGRCGRVGPGVCVRLYSEHDFENRPKYPTPEIQRSNLASVILQTKALRLGEVEKFPFIDPPYRSVIEDGYKTLYELGAIDDERELTELGKTLSRLPVDPRVARIILAADDENALRETLPIAAALAIQDPRERPRDKQEQADLKHAQFLDEDSDFLSYLKLWDFWKNLRDKTTKNQLRKACRENFLSYNRMKEWSDVYLQLVEIVRTLNLELKPRRDDYDSIHRALLTGLLYGVAAKSETTNEYQGTNSGKFIVWPGSGVKKKPRWLVGAERVETSRAFLRCVARVNVEWIEELGARLIKRVRKDPFWSRETGYVHAYERATLYGLTIVAQRRVNFGPIDPTTARSIFIQSALVERDFECALPFFEHNGRIEEEAKSLRDKLRKYDFVKSMDAIYDFYDKRLPQDVYDAVTLRKWFKEATPQERNSLFASLPDFCYVEDVDETTAEQFPDRFELDDHSQLPIEYRFEPGQESDGPTLIAPLEALRRIDSQRLGWLVPGLLHQRVVALLKTLPKEIRRELAPIAETAREIIADLRVGDGELDAQLARAVSRRTGRQVNARSFNYERVPIELQFNVKIVDGNGEEIAHSRDVDELRRQLGVEMNRSINSANDPKWNRDGLTRWDFGELPSSISIKRAGLTVAAYPALCDPRFISDAPNESAEATSTVSLRLFDSRDRALANSALGVRRLFTLENMKELRRQARWLPLFDRMTVYARDLKSFALEDAIAEMIANVALDLDPLETPSGQEEYEALAMLGKTRIGLATQEITSWLERFFESLHEAKLAIETRERGPARDAALDAKRQLERMLTPYFYALYPWRWVKEYPRYFKAICMRLDKWFNGGAKTDASYARQLEEYWARFEQRDEERRANGTYEPELDEFRWALEEYRVSLFAQKLGTVIKVSPVRLEKMWDAVAR